MRSVREGAAANAENRNDRPTDREVRNGNGRVDFEQFIHQLTGSQWGGWNDLSDTNGDCIFGGSFGDTKLWIFHNLIPPAARGQQNPQT